MRWLRKTNPQTMILTKLIPKRPSKTSTNSKLKSINQMPNMTKVCLISKKVSRVESPKYKLLSRNCQVNSKSFHSTILQVTSPRFFNVCRKSFLVYPNWNKKLKTFIKFNINFPYHWQTWMKFTICTKSVFTSKIYGNANKNGSNFDSKYRTNIIRKLIARS